MGPHPDSGCGPAPHCVLNTRTKWSSGWQRRSYKAWKNVPGRIVTKSLMACETGSWSTISYGRDGAGRPDLSSTPEFGDFYCGSWRCRICGPRVAASDFSRVATATYGGSWYYAVLTVNPADFDDRWAAFAGCYTLWQDRLRKRIERFISRYEKKAGRLRYIITFERHSSGWPHLNVLMGHPGLDAASEDYGVERRRKGKARTGRWCLKPNWRSEFARMAEGAGFGRVAWLERVVDAESWAGYVTKLAHELTGASNKGQSPFGAPKGFRRLRPTRGTLPPTFAQIRKASGEVSDRAWALSAEQSKNSWAAMPWKSRRPVAQKIFLDRASDAESTLGEDHLAARLRDIEHVLTGGIDWENVVPVWADQLKELTNWKSDANTGRVPMALDA